MKRREFVKTMSALGTGLLMGNARLAFGAAQAQAAKRAARPRGEARAGDVQVPL